MSLYAVKNDNISLTEKAAEQIIKYIQDNRLQPGDKLPIEAELGESLNVSRSTLRAAMYTLRTSGVVYVKQGSGTYVADMVGVSDDPLGLRFKYDQVQAVKELLELRFILEPQIAAISALRASQKEKADIMKLTDSVEDAINKGLDHTEADIEFHTRIAESTGNTLFKILIPEIARGIKLFSAITKDKILKETVITHRKIAEAIEAGDEKAAYRAMAEHLKYNEIQILK